MVANVGQSDSAVQPSRTVRTRGQMLDDAHTANAWENIGPSDAAAQAIANRTESSRSHRGVGGVGCHSKHVAIHGVLCDGCGVVTDVAESAESVVLRKQHKT